MATMNQAKFRYVQQRVSDLQAEEQRSALAALNKKYKQPIKPNAVLKWEESEKNRLYSHSKESRELRESIARKWKEMLDKAYLGEDEEILKLLTKKV